VTHIKNKILLGIFSLIVLAFVGCLMLVGRLIQRGFSTRDKPTAIEASLATSMRDVAIPPRYKVMKNPAAATPEVLHEAMAHWADHCAVCHANNGSGDTMFGKDLYPRPPDLRQQGAQQMSDGELYYTIKNGVRLSGMPAFGEPGDDDLASWKLVTFIRHLPSLTQDEELEMGQLNPKTPEEIEEEQQEQNFLNGGSSTQPQSHHNPKGAEQQ
jgi:mono/diheme cytochrome c family protein